MTEIDMEDLEPISCIGCGADSNLYINHEINQCSGEQITCLSCALEWQKNGGSW